MIKVALETVGCRLNQYETERIAAELVGAGMRRVAYKEKADLYILNSCTVTGRADADCRKLIKRARRLNDKAAIVVTGCYVVSQPDQIARLDEVDLAISNEEKTHIVQILRRKFPRLFLSSGIAGDDIAVTGGRAVSNEDTVVDRLVAFSPAPNRAMVKIGDGCNQGCSYCIVPRVRGPLVCLPPEDIIKEIRVLIDEGFHEVVLTAVHIGKYRYNGLNLAGLVERILNETDLSRLRLSSLEPNELDQSLLDLVSGNGRVCRHLHLPLQSGSNRILEMMRRPYRREDYLTIIERIKKSNVDITVGCDLIVGFPGEGVADFYHSLEILKSGCVDYAHVFSYSDRPGTAASDLPGKIAAAVIKERNRIAREIGESNRQRQMKSQIGKLLGVISEHNPDSRKDYHGVSDNYLKVKLPPEVGGRRRIIKFRPSALVGDCLEGAVISPQAGINS